MKINKLDTPVAIIDLDRVEANIQKLQQYLDEHGIVNRPHIKTHKTPALALMQLEAGITCQKIGEAEVMAAAGIKDIFIPYNIIGDTKLERLTALARTANISVTVDSEFTLRGLSEAAARDGVSITVLVEFDTGYGRCGVQTPQQAVDLACLMSDLPGVIYGGLMTFPVNDNTSAFAEETNSLLATYGITSQRISAGGTPQMWDAHTFTGVTEYRAGTYIFGDRYIMKSGAMALNDCALRVIATVISRPTEDHGILDSGSKTLSSDLLGLEGHGLILEYPEATIFNLPEEHGHVDFSACSTKPQIGERVSIIPNHCCVVSNLFNQLVAVRGNEVELTWEVAARGLLT
jgi:D-serine deaminase-like pyridoxal phosphate-dependent protein